MEFYVKVHKSDGEVLVAACDKSILGKTLKEGALEVSITKSFYGGELCKKQDFLDVIKGASIVNLMGDNIVDAAIEEGLIKNKNVLDVCGIKHAQIISL